MRTAFSLPRIGHHADVSPMGMLALQGLFLVIATIALYAYASTL